MNKTARLQYSHRCDELKENQGINRLVSEHVSRSTVVRIKHYLQQVIKRQKRTNFMKLPSLTALLNFFKVTPEVIQEVLNDFHQKGFDYEIINASEPILVWDTSKLTALSA